MCDLGLWKASWLILTFCIIFLMHPLCLGHYIIVFKGVMWRKLSIFSYLILKPSLTWQELCSEYRNYVRNGHLPCTRENDPIQGPDGKIHGNTCSMCEAFLWVELQSLLLLSVGEDRPVVGDRDDIEGFFLGGRWLPLHWVWGFPLTKPYTWCISL